MTLYDLLVLHDIMNIYYYLYGFVFLFSISSFIINNYSP